MRHPYDSGISTIALGLLLTLVLTVLLRLWMN
jgi:hypothetical protein